MKLRMWFNRVDMMQTWRTIRRVVGRGRKLEREVGEGGINFNVLCFVFTCYICLISENINTCSCCGKKFQISNLINLDAAQPNLT